MSNLDPSSNGDAVPEAVTEHVGYDPDLPESVHLAEHIRLADDDSDEQIVEKLKRQGARIGWLGVAPAVFWPSIIVVLAVVVLAVALPEATGEVMSQAQNWIVETFGWYYMAVIAGFVVFAIGVALSSLGKIRLGRDDEPAEFGFVTWFCMLFAAGMGIGLVFYGVGEPLGYATVFPKPGWEDANQAELSQLAMAQSFVHWGVHPWAIYAVIGLALAYAIHRRGRPVSIRWALEPLFGDRVKGVVGDIIDIVAIFGTVFGVATSLGLGVQQIAVGLQTVGIVNTVDNTVLIVLIIIVTFCAAFSVVSGLGAGIKWLSNINLSLAGIFMITILLLGPTLFLFQNFIQSIGVYLANVLQMSFDVGAYSAPEASGWFADWTIFYWGWWIAWAPFVGVFIARISRGRTVREFIVGALLVPTTVGFFWFAVMGGSGLYQQFVAGNDLTTVGEDGATTVDPPDALFGLLAELPLGTVLSFVAIVLVAIFFITSSDSGSLVIDMLASGGHPNPPTWSRLLWSITEGAVAITLLLAGGLVSLQAGSLITALPFSVILVLMCFATLRALRYDQRVSHNNLRRAEAQQVTAEVANQLAEAGLVAADPADRVDYALSRTKGLFNRNRRSGATRAPAPGTASGSEAAAPPGTEQSSTDQ